MIDMTYKDAMDRALARVSERPGLAPLGSNCPECGCEYERREPHDRACPWAWLDGKTVLVGDA
jgi:hypothetical protein